MVKFEQIRIGDCLELACEDALYFLDYRVLGESLDLKIPDMWKYENWIVWLVMAGKVLINNKFPIDLIKPRENLELVYCPITDDPRISIFSRYLRDQNIQGSFSKIINFLPHPDLDTYSNETGLPIHYKYSDFLAYNNKVAQKESIGNSPMNPQMWEVEDIEQIKTKLGLPFYLKRKIGSGGYSVINLEPMSRFGANIIPQDDISNWYIEESRKGVPSSVQCFTSSNGDTYIYAFCEQQMEGSSFVGGRIIDFKDSMKKSYLAQGLLTIVERLLPFIGGYSLFWGIDYLDDGNQISFIEGNIRPTAMSIPALLTNEKSNVECAIFREDSNKILKECDILIAKNFHSGTSDILSIQ